MPGKNIRLLIGIPTMGSVHPLLVQNLIRWGQRHSKFVSFYFTFKVAPVDRARNQLVKFFLECPESFTHLLFIDSDTIPPADAIERLLSHDKDIVTGLTPIIRYKEDGTIETYDNAFVEAERDPETGKVTRTFIAKRKSGLREIFRCGASCLLIRREVFEKLAPPYFRFIPNEDNTSHVRSEDINFCDEAKAAGFQLFADTDVVCGHYKEAML